MAKTLHRLYLRFRSPRIFLIALATFIMTSFLLHYFRGYDADWGGTNLTLSLEASVASAVLTVAAEETLSLLRTILKIVQTIEDLAAESREMLAVQQKTLKGVLLLAEAQRDALLALQEEQHGPQLK